MQTIRCSRKSGRLLYAALLGTSALVAAPAAAQTWVGISSASWKDPSAWTPNNVPSNTGVAVVDNNNYSSPIVDDAETVAELTVADTSIASVTIKNGGRLTVRDHLIIANQSTAGGGILLTGAGSRYDNSGDLALPGTSPGSIIGNNGLGAVSVLAGATWSDLATTLGAGQTGTGTLTVDGAGSKLESTRFVVGDLGNGKVTVSNGGLLLSDYDAYIGNQATSTGEVDVSGTGSAYEAFDLTVGNFGKGLLAITGGGRVDVGQALTIGLSTSPDAAVTIDGAGSVLTANNVDVGYQTGGRMQLTNAAQLQVAHLLRIGAGLGTSSTMLAIGNNTFVSAGSLDVGNNGSAEFDLTSGAQLKVQGDASLGDGAGALGTIKLDKTSAATFGSTLTIGRGGAGTLRDSGLVNSTGDVFVAKESTSHAGIILDGGIFASTGAAVVGQDGLGNVSLFNKGQFNVGSLVLGQDANSTGALGLVSQSASVVAGDLTIGMDGNGTVRVAEASSLRADGNGGAGTGIIYLARNSGSGGALIIGSVDGTEEAPGIVDVAKVEFGAGTAQLEFNHNNLANYNFDAVLTGGTSASTIYVLRGITTLTADSSGYQGTTLVEAQYSQGAKLVVNGALGGSVTVGGAGATLSSVLAGSGTLLGAVTVGDKGILESLNGGTLTMGSLTLGSGATLNVALTNPSAPTVFKVSGDLTLDGTLVASGTYGQGVYRLFDYGGTLTDNGLDIANPPPSGSIGDLTIQTSVAGQVNLVYMTGVGGNPPGGGGNPPPPAGSYSFWDGDAAGNAGNGKIDGGDGTWTATSTNFTDSSGAMTGTYDPNMVVFAGQGGNVTTSNADGALHFAFLQFENDGFALSGDAMALDPNATIYVGDHTAQGANYIESIANALTGAGGLTKDGLGTLILSGDNTYTGGTTIASGTLFVGAGGATGSILGNVDDEGVLTFDRTTDYTFNGVISGTGAVNSNGSGTLTLTAANTYTGATGVGTGTLSVTGNGSIAASSGLYLEFATFDISGVSGGGTSIQNLSGNGTLKLGGNTLTVTNASSLEYYGSIQGSGGLHIAHGQMTLGGDNSYTGGTVIDSGGVLAIGDGRNTGSITGDVVDNGIFAFSRWDDATFAGDISGTGVFGTEGTGSLTLTGTNTYTGGTAIFGSTLIGDTRSLQGDIKSTGHLVFNQDFDGTFAGVVTGTGDFTKSGTGTLIVAQAQGYTGATTINGGGLVVLAGLPGSDVTLNAGFLGGYGPIKRLNMVGGTLSPGQSPGTMVVLGDAILGKNSTYAVDLAAGGESDLLLAGGKVTLGGGALALNGTPTFGVTYQIIGAQGGVSGTFGTVSGAISKPFMLTKIDYQPDAVFVTLALNGAAIIGAAQTPNQTGAAQDVVTADPASPVVAAIANLDKTTAPGAFDQLSGEIHASLRGAITEDARATGDRLLETIGTRRGLWGEAMIGNRRIDGDGNAATVKGSVRSVLAGVDGGSNAVRVGVLAGYGWSDIDIAGRDSSARMEALRVGGYLTIDAGNGVELKAASLYSRWRGDISRSVSFTGYTDRLSSDDQADMLQGMAEIGWKAKAGKATIEPFGSLDWVSINGSAIDEKGGAAALTGRTEQQDSWFGKLGVRASVAIPSGGVIITPNASIAWERAFGNRLPTADLVFADAASGNGYAVTGPVAPRDRANGEVGIDIVGQRLDVGLSAGGSYANRTAQTDVKLHLRWEF